MNNYTTKRAPTVKHEFRCVNCGKKLRPRWNSTKTKLLGFGLFNLVCSKTCALSKLMQDHNDIVKLGDRFANKYNEND